MLKSSRPPEPMQQSDRKVIRRLFPGEVVREIDAQVKRLDRKKKKGPRRSRSKRTK